ncbi:hypothetical protein JAAARDRAFT_31273 [Jaapia argillacea MUCL 33604]|uniref:Uncharacterized protein n=1 Tax=Jaapia argillacea MUCL 33604 TaxID=933084 RepID=A0A067Q6K6_9AGAM|nr:hypothetical protein JAAARDRAFT_31273 [Jaapia argillacea MUCL 33604]
MTTTPIPRKRPRGLWKGRSTPAPQPVLFSHNLAKAAPGCTTPLSTSTHGSEPDEIEDFYFDDDDDDCTRSSTSGSSKRRRCSGPETEDESFTALSNGPSRPSPFPVSSEDSDAHSRSPSRRPSLMASMVTVVERHTQTVSTHCGHDEWEKLKDTFARAAEHYESDDISVALPLLRQVIHECHRFLLDYPDPSILFADPPILPQPSPQTLTPSDERLSRDWDDGEDYLSRRRSPTARRRKSGELPTAFHAILGITLFLFGNLIAQDAKLAVDGEPTTPTAYWLAALDVFETGENLPSRTTGSSDAEDWRMAIVWGRTLVCLADERVTRSLKAEKKGKTDDEYDLDMFGSFMTEEPNWPTDSPFHAIAQRRPPVTRRMSLSMASANDLMVLAMDQFSRGIFHMPHAQHHHNHHFNCTSSLPSAESLSFSRPKELFTIASEVLGVAERLDVASERQYWSSWADSVFNQMKMEADMDAWRGSITLARGRCWLIMGSSQVEELEVALDAGDTSVLNSELAEEAREGLAMAISFFERAKGSASSTTIEPDLAELQPLLAEALLTLANLTVDHNKREELYSRAQAEGGEQVVLDWRDEDVSMDES